VIDAVLAQMRESYPDDLITPAVGVDHLIRSVIRMQSRR
jgi:hypothetical protein